MKRNNNLIQEEQGVLELPKETWILVFHCIADQRLLPMRAVCSKWDEWIVEHGLLALTHGSRGFLKKMVLPERYKSLNGVYIEGGDFQKTSFWKRGKEIFTRLKIASIIETEGNTIYLDGLKHMTNLVSLRIGIRAQDIPMNIMLGLVNLRDIACSIYQSRNYQWLSQMTQIKTLALSYYPRARRITVGESTVIDQCLLQLTQLETLSLTDPLTNLSFLTRLTSLKRFSLSSDLTSEVFDYSPISHLVNLQSLELSSNPVLTSFSVCETMSQLECIIFPGIPINFVLLKKGLPKLKHVFLRLSYPYLVQNIKSLTNFIQKHPDRIDIGVSVYDVPDGIDIHNTYFHLFTFVLRNGRKFLSVCTHCRGLNGSCYYYLDSKIRRVFDIVK